MRRLQSAQQISEEHKENFERRHKIESISNEFSFHDGLKQKGKSADQSERSFYLEMRSDIAIIKKRESCDERCSWDEHIRQMTREGVTLAFFEWRPSYP